MIRIISVLFLVFYFTNSHTAEAQKTYFEARKKDQVDILRSWMIDSYENSGDAGKCLVAEYNEIQKSCIGYVDRYYVLYKYLIKDDVFIKYFGKSYFELTVNEYNDIYRQLEFGSLDVRIPGVKSLFYIKVFPEAWKEEYNKLKYFNVPLTDEKLSLEQRISLLSNSDYFNTIEKIAAATKNDTLSFELVCEILAFFKANEYYTDPYREISGIRGTQLKSKDSKLLEFQSYFTSDYRIIAEILFKEIVNHAVDIAPTIYSNFITKTQEEIRKAETHQLQDLKFVISDYEKCQGIKVIKSYEEDFEPWNLNELIDSTIAQRINRQYKTLTLQNEKVKIDQLKKEIPVLKNYLVKTFFAPLLPSETKYYEVWDYFLKRNKHYLIEHFQYGNIDDDFFTLLTRRDSLNYNTDLLDIEKQYILKKYQKHLPNIDKYLDFAIENEKLLSISQQLGLGFKNYSTVIFNEISSSETSLYKIKTFWKIYNGTFECLDFKEDENRLKFFLISYLSSRTKNVRPSRSIHQFTTIEFKREVNPKYLPSYIDYKYFTVNEKLEPYFNKYKEELNPFEDLNYIPISYVKNTDNLRLLDQFEANLIRYLNGQPSLQEELLVFEGNLVQTEKYGLSKYLPELPKASYTLDENKRINEFTNDCQLDRINSTQEDVNLAIENQNKEKELIVYEGVVLKPDQIKYQPYFEGGYAGWHSYLDENLTYPDDAKKNNTKGTVYLACVVELDGNLTNIEVLRGIGSGCNEEAIRLLEESPKWHPGKKRDGTSARSRTMITIKF